jgi:hypothetical protein
MFVSVGLLTHRFFASAEELRTDRISFVGVRLGSVWVGLFPVCVGVRALRLFAVAAKLGSIRIFNVGAGLCAYGSVHVVAKLFSHGLFRISA